MFGPAPKASHTNYPKPIAHNDKAPNPTAHWTPITIHNHRYAPSNRQYKGAIGSQHYGDTKHVHKFGDSPSFRKVP